MRKQEDRMPLLVTIPAPKPADFPLGSVESRAAAIMVNARAEQDAGEWTMYIAHFDVNQEVRPLYAEPQQQDAVTAASPLPDPGESPNDPPTPTSDHPDIITVEVG